MKHRIFKVGGESPRLSTILRERTALHYPDASAYLRPTAEDVFMGGVYDLPILRPPSKNILRYAGLITAYDDAPHARRYLSLVAYDTEAEAVWHTPVATAVVLNERDYDYRFDSMTTALGSSTIQMAGNVAMKLAEKHRGVDYRTESYIRDELERAQGWL